MEHHNQTLTPIELADVLGGITVQGVYKALKSHNILTHLTHNRRKLIPSEGIRKLFEERGFKYPKARHIVYMHRNSSYGNVSIFIYVLFQHRAEIHLVQLVAR